MMSYSDEPLGDEPVREAAEQLVVRRVPGMSHAWLQPQLGRSFPGRGGEHARVVEGEVRVAVAVDDQQWGRGDQRHGLDRGEGDRIPLLGVDPGTEAVAADEPAEGSGDHPVQPPHRGRTAVVPACGGADGGDRVRTRRLGAPPVHRSVPQHHRAPQRETNRHHAAVTEGARPLHRGRQIEHLAVADRGAAAGGSVPPERERDHGRTLRERPRRPAHRRPVHRPRETVRDDDRSVRDTCRTRLVHGLNSDPVLRKEDRPTRLLRERGNN